MPIYITHLGGTPLVVGLVMAAFAVTSLLQRPLVGYWSDRWSEAGVMIAGLLIQGASVFLCFIPFIGTTMLANSCRGVGWASLNSGGYALLAHYAPAARCGGCCSSGCMFRYPLWRDFSCCMRARSA